VTTTEALAYQVVAPAIAMLRQTQQVVLVVGVRSLGVARPDADSR
jgi:hypothetical protein